MLGASAHSTVSLILASENGKSVVEAWCIKLFGKSSVPNTTPLNICSYVLGAALLCPPKLSREGFSFTPLVCLVKKKKLIEGQDETDETSIETDTIIFQIIKIKVEGGKETNSPLSIDTVLEEVELNVRSKLLKSGGGKIISYKEPVMTTGSTPYVFVLCLENVIVVIFRKYGFIMSYLYDEDGLKPLGTKTLEHYVVDASISRGSARGEVEVVVLLSLPDTKDGFMAQVHISQVGFFC